ncbi:hypothetical protein MCERE10_00304 [Burkholderiaceae bacterium]
MWTWEWPVAPVVAQTLTDAQGDQVVIDNRSAGGTMIGTHFAKAVC